MPNAQILQVRSNFLRRGSCAVVLLTVFAVAGEMISAASAREPAPFVHVWAPNSPEVHVIFDHGQADPVLAHYTEHLVWLSAIGGTARSADRHSNAWTNDFTFGYWLSGTPTDLPDLLATLSGVFDPIDLPHRFATQERDIMEREYEYRIAGDPDGRATEELDVFLYSGNAIAASVVGTPGEIRAQEYDDARALQAETHRPENATLVVIGDVTERQVRRAIRESNWPEPDVARAEGAPTPIDPGARAEGAPTPFDLAAPVETTLRFPYAQAAPRLIWRRVVTLPELVQFDLLEAQAALLRDILNTNLPGGLAGPLRFDAAIARSFEVQIRPIDEDNVEISVHAAPDRDVSLTALRDAFESTFSETVTDGIAEDTYDRVRNRFDGFWPDWDDENETARWMADYVLSRVPILRDPLSLGDLKRLEPDLSLETTNALLHQLAGEGRTASAFIGPEDSFE